MPIHSSAGIPHWEASKAVTVGQFASRILTEPMRKARSGIEQPKSVPGGRIVEPIVLMRDVGLTDLTWGSVPRGSVRGDIGRGDIGRDVLRTSRLDHSLGKALFLGVWSWPLMRRPRAGHRLASHSKPVHHLWPSPDGRTLPCLWRVLDQLVKPGITSAVSVRLDRHRLAPLWLQCRLLVGSLASRVHFDGSRGISPHG